MKRHKIKRTRHKRAANVANVLKKGSLLNSNVYCQTKAYASQVRQPGFAFTLRFHRNETRTHTYIYVCNLYIGTTCNTSCDMKGNIKTTTAATNENNTLHLSSSVRNSFHLLIFPTFPVSLTLSTSSLIYTLKDAREPFDHLIPFSYMCTKRQQLYLKEREREMQSYVLYLLN